MTVASQVTVHAIPWVTPSARRRARRLYDLAWVRNRNGGPWEAPANTRSETVTTPLGEMVVRRLVGEPGQGTVVLAHPDRRYGGHWFVKEGIVNDLHAAGYGVAWYDNPGYGQGKGGSPYLAENVLNVAAAAKDWDAGPVRVFGVSLGSFATAIAAPYMPWVSHIVLESPYRNFMSWYEGKDGSIDKLAMRVFGLLFRRDAERLDARTSIGDFQGKAMISVAEQDDITPPHLSEAVGEGNDVTWHRSPTAKHLHMWQDSAYRAAVLDFIR